MKKKIYLLTLITAAATTVLFNGCKKDDDPEPTKTELLTNKNWRMTAFVSDPAVDLTGSGVPVTNVFNQFPACQKDDLTKFLTNSTVNFDEGVSKCDPNDPQTTTGSWAFNSNQTVITISEPGVPASSYTIETLTEGTLKANTTFDNGLNVYTFTVTWTKN